MIWILGAIALAGPDTGASCDTLARHYGRQLRERPADRPELWWLEDEACPIGATLAGNPPPEGDAVWCEDKRLRRQGPRTQFSGGRIVLHTRFVDDVETGPRIEWAADGHVSRMTALRDGAIHGEQLQWTDDGGITVAQHAKGQLDGATWRFDPEGQLLLVEHWEDGQRDGRSCTWRDGQVDTDQMWSAGIPLPAE